MESPTTQWLRSALGECRARRLARAMYDAMSDGGELFTIQQACDVAGVDRLDQVDWSDPEVQAFVVAKTEEWDRLEMRKHSPFRTYWFWVIAAAWAASVVVFLLS